MTNDQSSPELEKPADDALVQLQRKVAEVAEALLVVHGTLTATSSPHETGNAMIRLGPKVTELGFLMIEWERWLDLRLRA